jgi:metal-sulfur cluster biosynthetic enzyme
MDKPLTQSAPAEAVSDMAPTTISDETMERIYAALHMVDDPELGINIVDLGLIYGVQMREDGFVTITMTLTTPGCPMHASLADGVGAALSQVPGVTGGEIHLVWEPRWTPDMLTEEGRSALGYY